MKENINYEWTVFFLIRSIKSYWNEADKMIKEILGVKLHRDLAIIICLNVDSKQLSENYPRGNNPAMSGFTTVFYKVKRNTGAKQGKNENSLEFINEKIDFDIRNPDHIIDHIQKDVLRQCSAEKYMLFTWDHGAPFGVFKDGDGVSEEEQVAEPSGARMLSIDDLSKAITISFDGRKIDIITMMNCYVQFFDTGYSLSSVSKFLIAPETFMLPESYDYKAIFQRMSQEINISPKALSEFIVQSFSRKNKETQKRVALFANQLKYYKVFGVLIDKLGSDLLVKLPYYKEAIANARGKLTTVNGAFSVIDFFYFTKLLRRELPEDWNKNLFKKLKKIKRKVIVARYIGEKYLNESSPVKQAPKGFSIFFAANKSRLCGEMVKKFFYDTSPSATLFSRVAQWNNFVIAYLTIDGPVEC